MIKHTHTHTHTRARARACCDRYCNTYRALGEVFILKQLSESVIESLYRHYLHYYGGMDWIELAQDRDIWRGTFECGNEPSGSTKCGEFLD